MGGGVGGELKKENYQQNGSHKEKKKVNETILFSDMQQKLCTFQIICMAYPETRQTVPRYSVVPVDC